MKILIFIFFSFIFSQNSILSINGFGESNNYQNSTSSATGQIELFSISSNSGNPSAIATIWKNRFTSINVTSQFQSLHISQLNIFTNGIELLSISFPISDYKVLQFSINPQYWSQYSINENNQNEVFEFNGINYSYNSHYYGRGGFSSFGLTWSQKINDKFSIGVGLDNYFGNKFQSDSTFLYNISMNAEGEDIISPNSLSITNSTHHYQGYGLKFAGIFYIKNLELGFSLKQVGPFIISKNKYYSVGLIQSEEIIENIELLYRQFNFGLKSKITKNFGILTELKTKDWQNLNPNLLILHSQNYNEKRFSLGSYYDFLNIGRGYFDSVSFRSGLFYKVFENFDTTLLIKDYGVTIGSGFRYNNNANSINLSIIFGNRNYNVYGIQSEEYIDFILGIEVGEKWFEKK
tara:strand:+ start:1213 stop:2430 length:1218 start_codon:yes stop_codon:yes gene_type:complete